MKPHSGRVAIKAKATRVSELIKAYSGNDGETIPVEEAARRAAERAIKAMQEVRISK